jgi:shikimate kinase
VTPAVVLVGPPGAGKTTVGQIVADRRGLVFRDVDRDIETTTGMSVADIFVEQGEDEFRRLEREAVTRALREHDGVLALGGGAVLAPDTRALLTAHRVVFLDVGLSEAAERVGFNRSRPLLVVNPRAELARMLTERRPLYDEVATVCIGTDNLTAADVAAAVEMFLDVG